MVKYYFNEEEVDAEDFDNRLEEEAEEVAKINGIYQAWICQETTNEKYEEFISNIKSQFYEKLKQRQLVFAGNTYKIISI